MRCENCGMEHGVNENRLCSGPYVTQRTYDARERHLTLLLSFLRNEFNHVVKRNNITLEDGSLNVLGRVNSELNR